MNTQAITLDVTKRPQVAPVVRFGEGDHDGTTLEATILDGGTPLSLDGYSVRLCMKMPDGRTYYSVDGESEGNVATFLVDEQYLSPHGKTDCAYVEVYDGDELVCSTSRFSAVILRSAKDGAVISEQYISEIDAAVDRCDESASAAEEVLEHGIPLMTAERRGGAKLGTGLTMTGEYLDVDVAAAGGVTQSEKGAANGVASLDSSGLVPSGQLPSYVDDVVEGYYYEGGFYEESTHETPIVGETGKIYVDLSTDTSYRWSGSAYISISNPIDIATEAEALAGNDNAKMMTPLRVKQVVTGDIAPNSVTTGDVTAEDVTADSVTSSGEVTATETIAGGTRTHELTEKLDEDDYLSGLTWDQLAGRFTWDDLAGTMGQDETTQNLDLAKPAHVSAAAMNANMDILDAAVGAVDVTEDGSLSTQVAELHDSVAHLGSLHVYGEANANGFSNIPFPNGAQGVLLINASTMYGIRNLGSIQQNRLDRNGADLAHTVSLSSGKISCTFPTSQDYMLLVRA